MAKSKIRLENEAFDTSFETEAVFDNDTIADPVIDPVGAAIFSVASVDAFQKGVEKAAEMNKQNVTALVESMSAVTKGLEQLSTEAVSFAKAAFEDGVKTSKALMAVKSPQEFATLQSDYTRAAFDQFVNQAAKFNDLGMTAVKNAYAPINERVTAVSKAVQKARIH